MLNTAMLNSMVLNGSLPSSGTVAVPVTPSISARIFGDVKTMKLFGDSKTIRAQGNVDFPHIEGKVK